MSFHPLPTPPVFPGLQIGVFSVISAGSLILAGKLVKLMRWHGKEGQMNRAVAPSKVPACWLMGGTGGLGELSRFVLEALLEEVCEA